MPDCFFGDFLDQLGQNLNWVIDASRFHEAAESVGPPFDLLCPLGAKLLERLANVVCTRGVDTQLPLIPRLNPFCNGHAHVTSLLHDRRGVDGKSQAHSFDGVLIQFDPGLTTEQGE